MLQYSRGYNGIYALWTGFGFPNSLQPAPGQPALSWEEFCTNLEAAGVDRLRVKLVGWEGPLGTDAHSFEPPRWADTHPTPFNDWDGRLQEAAAAAQAHGVGFHVIPFDNEEWKKAWYAHAWNSANGGFLTDPRAALSDPRALQAAEARIDAIIAALGDTISCWEICAEMTWLMNPGWWGVDGWAEMPAVIHGIAVPWVEHIAQYIHAHHTAPVGNGQVRDLGGAVEIKNEIYRTPSLDFALINWYGDGPVSGKVNDLRAAQAYTGKPIYVEQYAPWDLGQGASYTREPVPDYPWSKAHEWAAVCGERGCVGPCRWPEIRPTGEYRQWWGVAAPEMAEIASVTADYAQTVQADEWESGESWDDWISGPIEYVSSWSDGQHLTAFVSWENGAGAPDMEIEGLDDGAYSVRYFDWIDGNMMDQYAALSVGGLLPLPSSPARDGHSVLYLSRQEPPAPPARVTLRLTDSTGQAAEMTVEAGQTYTLEVLEEAQP